MNDYTAVLDTIEGKLKGLALDGYEICLGSSRNLSVEVKEQKVDTFKCSSPVGVSVRVLREHGMGFSYSTSFADADVARMIENALAGASYQTPDDFNTLPEKSAVPVPEVGCLFDENLVAIPEEEKIAVAMNLERSALAADPQIKRVRKASYGESAFSVQIRNSRGITGRYSATSVSCSLSAVAEADGDSQMGWDFCWSNFFRDIDPGKVARTAAEKAKGLLGATKIDSMNCPAILDRYVAGEILDVLAPAFLAENVLKGKSLLADRVGQPIASSLLRIRDDGTLPGGMATTPFDGEGVPHRNVLLVDGGVLCGYLYDTYYGARSGMSSTGNAVRGGAKGLPHLGVTNFFIENGTTSFSGLCAGIDRGVYITDVMGMHTANPVSGDFSVGASGFLIENGRITVPIKGIAISGNILGLLQGVEGVADDLRFYGEVGSPSLRIAALDVSGH